ncbi:E3 ubiquitin-protein ligase RFWD3-like isoform X2 [Gordionus sp. m RMFG-2023]|uniref:E3 ubiquitin-protein ligase RFWD3-like isoform X2 n=1 Tax=Gordionus sp. m RMFG-2023 TaxID=3053472 RepID=UPI0031FC601A
MDNSIANLPVIRPTISKMSETWHSCAICFDSFTNYGEHRLACLKCGHLFGFNCIKKWLQDNDKCPQCNAKSRIKDIRILYARVIKVIDTVEKDKALELVEKEKELKYRMELKLLESKVMLEMTQKECYSLRNQVSLYQKQLETLTNTYNIQTSSFDIESNSRNQTYHLKHSLDISKDGSCRVMAYDPSMNLLAVSQGNDSPIVSKFGVKKVNILDMKLGEYVGIHDKPIKDLSFNSHPSQTSSSSINETLLLSVSLDKCVHLTSMNSNTIIQRYYTEFPSWSCCWNGNNLNQFYIGSSNGIISMFDLRNTATHLCQLTECQQMSKSPIVCLRDIDPPDIHCNPSNNGGILVGQLDKCYYFHQNSNLIFSPKLLELEGSLVDINYDKYTRHVLSSYRPTSKHRTTRYQLFTIPEPLDSIEAELAQSPQENNINIPFIDCNLIHTFKGGSIQTLLTKSHMFINPECNLDYKPGEVISKKNIAGGSLQICAGDEESKQIFIWDAQTSKLRHRLHTLTYPILDVLSITNHLPNHLLLGLSSKQLQIYKWKEASE